jgi:cytochrome oxidase Cu insertion factor (SCO1/SenC/PrrC family)
MRQVNTALGKNMDRLQRLFLSNKVLDENTEINLLRSYPNLILIKNKPNKIHGLIKGISDNKNSLLLVDPLGNVILRYDSNFDGKKLLKDIKKLLKLSRVG